VGGAAVVAGSQSGGMGFLVGVMLKKTGHAAHAKLKRQREVGSGLIWESTRHCLRTWCEVGRMSFSSIYD
jgi:hypothetical protein